MHDESAFNPESHARNHIKFFRSLIIGTWVAQNRARHFSELLDKVLESSKRTAAAKRKLWPSIALSMMLIFNASQILFPLKAEFVFVGCPDTQISDYGMVFTNALNRA